MLCVGVPIGTPEFVNAFVRFKANAIEQVVQKLRIVHDPKIHYDLLRFCQYSLARNVPPDAMLRPADVIFDPRRGDWALALFRCGGKDLCLPRFPYRTQLSSPFFNGACEPPSRSCSRMNWNGAA